MPINRTEAEALIQEQVVNTIFQDAPRQSVFLSMARKLPNMTSKQTRVPVLDMLPMAYWVNGDTGHKQTSQQAWDNVYLTAAELAVIVPIPEAVLDDASFDIIGEVTPRINEAIGQRVDSATIFGVNRPSEWQNDIITLARQAGNNVSGGITYDTLLGAGGLFAKVEASGRMATGIIASMQTRAALRGLKDSDGRPLFKTDMQGATPYALDGVSMQFPLNGSFDTSVAQMVAGDFSQAVYSIRQDVTVKILDQATIVDPDTKLVLYSLAQQDMIAIRVVFRMGWALPNPATRMDEKRLTVPFAYIEASMPYTAQKVTFTVKDNQEEPAAVEGVTVNVNGSRKKTGADGTVEFNLRAGSYPVKISKSGYTTQHATVTVAASAVTQAITLPISN